MFRGLCLPLALVLLAAAQQPPTFRSGVDLVTVDVSVLDDTGRPLDTLRAEDFQVLVDGQPRAIVSVQFVGLGLSASRAPAPAPADRSSLVASNEPAIPGRLILFAVDRRTIRRAEGAAALRAAADFVDRLDPADRVAAVGLHDEGVAFTTDHAAVKRTLSTLTGRADRIEGTYDIGLAEALAISDGELAPLDRAVQRLCGARLGTMSRREAMVAGRNPCPIHVEQQSRAIAQYTRAQAQQSLGALLELLRQLARLEGRKTLILLSEGLVAEPQRIDFTALAAAAQRARVSVYVLHAEPPMFEAAESSVSPTLTEDFKIRGEGLRRLAGATGGAVFPLIGTGKRPFDRILQELSGYYLLAFEQTPYDRDGRPHRISVSVRRPGTVVRARSAFEVPLETSAAPSIEERLVQLLRVPRPATELPLRLAAWRSRGTSADTVRTIVGVETDPSPDVAFGLVLVDDGGVVATSAVHRSARGRYSLEAVLPTGNYLLRAAAIDAAGRIGTIEQDLELRLPQDAGVRVSDLVLAERPAPAGATLNPIVDRTSAAALVALLEFYDAPAAPTDAVLFEVAAAAGQAPVQTTRAAARRVDDSRSLVRADLDLQALPPGRYVVTATLEPARPDSLRLSRSFVLVR